jgi:hypothetical protein
MGGTEAKSIIHTCQESRFEYLASPSPSSLGSPPTRSHPRYQIGRFTPNLRRVFFSFEHDTLVMLAQGKIRVAVIYYYFRCS